MPRNLAATPKRSAARVAGYDVTLSRIVKLLEHARRTTARNVNAVMTATYWEIGRHIVEHEQAGKVRARYGQALIEELSADLSRRFGRGFGRANLYQMRAFHLAWPHRNRSKNLQTLSGVSARAQSFPLPWSHYVCLLSADKPEARAFYEQEALRGGWSIRQLSRQIGSLFYERTLMSRDKAAMLSKGKRTKPGEALSPEQEIKDPLVLEFLDLKDEYSESELEAGLIRRLEEFLLELGGEFTFVGRQRRLRIDDVWFRVDLVMYHRRLRCLVIIELKTDPFTHADVGQMNVYLNYAREHWTHADENPPVGLILSTSQKQSLARYALAGLHNKMLAAEYRTALPDELLLAAKLAETRQLLETARVLGNTRQQRKSTAR